MAEEKESTPDRTTITCFALCCLTLLYSIAMITGVVTQDGVLMGIMSTAIAALAGYKIGRPGGWNGASYIKNENEGV